MKLEDLLSEDKQTELQLHKQVEIVKEELEYEEKRFLQRATEGPAVIVCRQSCPCLFSLLPFKVQMLRAEVALVEEEIGWLERRISELRLDIYQEKNPTKQRPQWDRQHLKKITSGQPSQMMIQHKDHDDVHSTSHDKNYENRISHGRIPRKRRASFGSTMELQTITSPRKYDHVFKMESRPCFSPLQTKEERGNSRCSTSDIGTHHV